jgi:hypothetical protein
VMGLLLSVSETESVYSLSLAPLFHRVGRTKVQKWLSEAAPLNPLRGMPESIRHWVLMPSSGPGRL